MAPIGSPSGSYGDNASMHYDILETIKNAQRANVAIYTISPAGLEAPGPGTTLADLSLDALNNETNETGGFAIANTNSFDAQIGQIFRETGSYYLIGFSSSHRDGKFRRIEVEVDRPGLMVRTRNGYHAPEGDRKERRTRPGDTPLPLAKAISGVLPMPDMPMRVTVAPFAVRGKDAAEVAIVLGLQHPTPGVRVVETVDLLSQAFDTDGKPRGWFRQAAQLTFRPSEAQEARYEVLSHLSLRPGRYQLRFAIHSGALGKSGSVYHDVEVPDFRRQPVSLSGLVFGVEPALPAAPRGFLAHLMPLSPTSQRSFSRSDQASAFVRVYAREKNPPPTAVLATSILDQRDRQVYFTRDELPDLRSASTVDHFLRVPLDRLGPGPYLLRVELMAGKTAVRREARFYVR